MSKLFEIKTFKKLFNKNKAQKVSALRSSARKPSVGFKPLAGQVARKSENRNGNVARNSREFGRRYRMKDGGLLSSFVKKAANLFDFSKRSDSAALDFAANHRRRSKRDKRRRILAFSGIGAVVLAVVLVVILVPNGAAANSDDGRLVAANQQGDTPGITALGAKMPVVMPFTSFSEEDEDSQVIDGTDLEMTQTQEPEATPLPTTAPETTPPPVKVDDLIDFFVVKADAYYNKMGYSSNSYKYTTEEYLMLARIIDGEARGESFKGKVAVGNVIMNRVLNRSSSWPSDIISVVSAPGQFSVYNRVKDKTPSSSAKRAARAVLDYETWEIPQDVYFFKAGGSEGANWGRNKYYVRIGGHCFYTYSYSGRNRGGGVPPALFDRTYKYAQYGCKPENRVYRIQYMLNKLGYKVKADKFFGKDTKEALMDFQTKHKLEADGVAGPTTVKKLILEFGLENYYERFVKE